MLNPLRSAIVILSLAAVLMLAPAAPAAGAAATHTNLTLHKWKYHFDDNGHLFVSVQLVNRGNKMVHVKGIAPSRWGPWTVLGKDVKPDEKYRASIKVEKDPPKHVWVDSSEGLLTFDLPTGR